MTTLGRPTAYRREYCELAHNYCLLGATNAELADFFDVAPRTIDNWIASHSAFADAVQRGRIWPTHGSRAASIERAIGCQHPVERKVLHLRRGGQLNNRALSARHASLHLLAAQPAARRTGADGVRRGPERPHAVAYSTLVRRGRRCVANDNGASEALARFRSRRSRLRESRPCLDPPADWRRRAQAGRFFSARPIASQAEPMKIRSMPRKMPSVYGWSRATWRRSSGPAAG